MSSRSQIQHEHVKPVTGHPYIFPSYVWLQLLQNTKRKISIYLQLSIFVCLFEGGGYLFFYTYTIFYPLISCLSSLLTTFLRILVTHEGSLIHERTRSSLVACISIPNHPYPVQSTLHLFTNKQP